MIISKEQLAAIECCGNNEKYDKKAIEWLQVDRNVVTATNGHIIVEIKDNSGTSIQQMPAKLTDVIIPIQDKPVYIHRSIVSKIKGLIPKKTTIPILKKCLVGKDKDGDVSIGTTDIGQVSVIKCEQPPIDFPDTKRIYDADGDQWPETAKISISVHVLEQLVNVIKAVKGCSDDFRIDFVIHKEIEPIRFHYENTEKKIEVGGILAPVKETK